VRIAVLNGPNLNLLGTREPGIYGSSTLADVESQLTTVGREIGVEVEFAQANGEGELVDVVHGYRGRVDGAVVNAGAYSHSSLALRDALVGVHVPYVEVHISNVHAREPERHRTMLGATAEGQVTGLGVYGYELAMRGLVARLKSQQARG
jgi:3-dehydroquinate dehydratase-2